MSINLLLLLIAALIAGSYLIGRSRAQSLRNRKSGDALHSLPRYYGYQTAIWCGLPAVVLLVLWTALESTVLTRLVAQDLPPAITSLPQGQFNQWLNLLPVLGEPILLGFNGADAARELAGQDDDALVGAALGVLERAYGL